MTERYLLYIDILGFEEMIRNEPKKVDDLYAILDSLNVHEHKRFKTIVFSDTVLVYNAKAPQSNDEHDNLVGDLIEFAEDLHRSLTGLNIFFRAVLTIGRFTHYNRKNIECFYGEALIDAYLKEKEIPSVGLFIDKKCNSHNKYFRTEQFDNDLLFVYLNRNLEDFNEFVGGKFPVMEAILDELYPDMPWEVRFLKEVHTQMRTHPTPRVRVKYMTAWDLYKKRYGNLLTALEQGNFALNTLIVGHAWHTEQIEMEKKISEISKFGIDLI